MGKPVMQPWVCELTFMQQSVLISAVRGPDGLKKHHPIKPIMRWYRRCILYSAFDKNILNDPYDAGGGSFTGPLDPDKELNELYSDFFDILDELPYHFVSHFMTAVEILGYKHDIEYIQEWWFEFYKRMAKKLHLGIESEEDLDFRLSDNEERWSKKEVK